MYKRHVRETRFCHRPFSSKLYERNRKGEIGGNSIERSTEYRSAISVMSNQPSESFRKIFTQFLFDYTSRFHFHSFNAITRRARVHLAILLEAEQLVVVEITHVATQPCFYAWLQRELIGVWRQNTSLRSVKMVQSSTVDLDLWLVRIVHSYRVTILDHNSPL